MRDVGGVLEELDRVDADVEDQEQASEPEQPHGIDAPDLFAERIKDTKAAECCRGCPPPPVTVAGQRYCGTGR